MVRIEGYKSAVWYSRHCCVCSRELKPQQPHCEHECVCKEYREWYASQNEIDAICPDIICEHRQDHPRLHTPAPAIHMCCDKCGSIAPHFDGEQWLCTKCLQAEAARTATLVTLDTLQEKIYLETMGDVRSEQLWLIWDDVKAAIESLRSTAGEQEARK